MARYKVLKSVAHNFAHSFVSVMNYTGRDYTMCELMRRVKLTKTRVLRIDVLSRTLGPVELLSAPVVRSCESYLRDFGRLVTSSGAALDMVESATIEVRVALAKDQAQSAKQFRGRVTATMRLRDDRGREYVGRATENYTCGGLR